MHIKNEMTSKERVRSALDLLKPDRIPVFPVITCLHASRVIGKNMKDLVLNPTMVYDSLIEAWKEYGFDGFEVPLDYSNGWLNQFNVIRENDGFDYLYRSDSIKPYARLEENNYPFILEDEDRVNDESEIDKIPVIKSDQYIKKGQLDGVFKVIKAVGQGAFIAGQCGNQTMNSLVRYRGVENGLIDLIENKKLAHSIMQRATDATIEVGKAFIEAGVDCIYIGDAWCNSNIISPAQFDEFCVPQYKRAVNVFHKYGVKVYLHICGNSVPILESMANTGVDAVEPLDPLGGVELDDAKRRIGKKVCLKGGINTLTLLNGDEAQIKQEVISCIEKAGKDGAFIFGTGDDIPRDAKIENVKTMVNTVKEFGRYF